MRRLSTAIVTLAFLTFSLVSLVSATAVTTPPSVDTNVACGSVDLVFHNPTPWLYAFEYRVDNEPAVSQSPYYPSDPDQYHVVNVAAGTDQTTTLTFDEDSGQHSVTVRLRLGAESDYFFGWTEPVTIESDCMAPTPTPTIAPTPTPSATPTPTPSPNFPCYPFDCGPFATSTPAPLLPNTAIR